jgi:hypothetical protein
VARRNSLSTLLAAPRGVNRVVRWLSEWRSVAADYRLFHMLGGHFTALIPKAGKCVSKEYEYMVMFKGSFPAQDLDRWHYRIYI